MKIIEVPVLNPDGSLQYTAFLPPEEVQYLLQFALNLSSSVGLTAHKKYVKDKEEVQYPDDLPQEFND